MGEGRKDFFVSHAGSDGAWAEWVAWQLTEAGYTVVLDVWDWAAGQDFITKISDALDRCDRVLALWSGEYFNPARYTRREWSAALAEAPGAAEGRLVPVRVEEVPAEQVPGSCGRWCAGICLAWTRVKLAGFCWRRSAAPRGMTGNRPTRAEASQTN